MQQSELNHAQDSDLRNLSTLAFLSVFRREHATIGNNILIMSSFYNQSTKLVTLSFFWAWMRGFVIYNMRFTKVKKKRLRLPYDLQVSNRQVSMCERIRLVAFCVMYMENIFFYHTVPVHDNIIHNLHLSLSKPWSYRNNHKDFSRPRS